VRSHSPFTTERRGGGTPTRYDTHDSERRGESMRGRFREKGKDKCRDFSYVDQQVSVTAWCQGAGTGRTGFRFNVEASSLHRCSNAVASSASPTTLSAIYRAPLLGLLANGVWLSSGIVSCRLRIRFVTELRISIVLCANVHTL
jgi:hypothetical protein